MQARLNPHKVAPGVYKAMIAAGEYVNKCGLEPALLELVKLRASQINGCAFCLNMHATDARKHGETNARLDLLPAWREVSVYSPRERAALAWTEALTRLAGGTLSDEDYEEGRRNFSEEELVNLTMAIVMINGWNRINVAFHVQPQLAAAKAA
jgi:AhpD family alkylhydroperoxidase